MPSLLITRPKASTDRFVARLSSDLRERFPVVISPLMRIVPIGDQPDLTNYKAVIFTSTNAVEFGPHGNERYAYCVGEETAKRARMAGWQVVTTAVNADGLVDDLAATGPIGPILHLAGRHRRGEIAQRMTARGTQVDVYTLYDQKLLPLSDEAQSLLDGEGRVVVPLFSPRTATQFIDQARKLDRVTMITMSKAVAQVCKGSHSANVLVAVAATGQEMIRSVEKAMYDISSA